MTTILIKLVNWKCSKAKLLHQETNNAIMIMYKYERYQERKVEIKKRREGYYCSAKKQERVNGGLLCEGVFWKQEGKNVSYSRWKRYSCKGLRPVTGMVGEEDELLGNKPEVQILWKSKSEIWQCDPASWLFSWLVSILIKNSQNNNKPLPITGHFNYHSGCNFGLLFLPSSLHHSNNTLILLWQLILFRK